MGKKWIVELDEKTDEEFRKVIAETKGLHKGVIKEATEEAIDLWIKEQKRLQKEFKEIEQGRK